MSVYVLFVLNTKSLIYHNYTRAEEKLNDWVCTVEKLLSYTIFSDFLNLNAKTVSALYTTLSKEKTGCLDIWKN